MLVIVANRIARESRVGPHHAAVSGGNPAPSSRLIASPATTGSSTSKPERDDQRRDRHLLQIDAEHLHHAERHGQRDRNGERHQQRRAPLPKADQRHEHHQHDRLVQALHEQVDVLLHLPRLVRGASEDQILRAGASSDRADCRPRLCRTRGSARPGACPRNGHGPGVCHWPSALSQGDESSENAAGSGNRGWCPPSRAR